MMNNVFVVGCARSGTSILGELIASHPDVKYIFEASIWEVIAKDENVSHRLAEKNANLSVEKFLRDWMETQAQSNKLLVEKNPRNSLRIPFIHHIFPKAKIIHIIRDGRDVACSMVPGCGGDEWNHLKPPNWQKYFTKYRGAVRCAYVWKEVLEIALNDLQGVDHLQVNFEELVNSPRTVAEKIFSYLQLEMHPKTISFCNLISNRTIDSYHANLQKIWFTEDHDVRIGRWKKNLNLREKLLVNMILWHMLRRTGY